MFENMLDTIDSTIDLFMESTYQALATAVTPVLMGVLTIVVVLYGLSVAFGRDLNFSNTLSLVVRIVVIYFLATGWSFFSTVLFRPLSETPGELAVVVASQAGASNVNQLIDDFIVTGWDAISVLQQQAGISNLGAFVLALIMMIATLLVGAVSFVIFALAKVVLALSIALAPIFVGFLAFQSTRGWFESWLRMLLQAGLVLILAAGSMAIVMAMSQDGQIKLQAATAAGSISATNCLGYLTLAFVTMVLMPQLNNIAASLAAGGAALSVDGVRRYAQRILQTAQRADHEKYRRRYEGPEGRPVTTAGSVVSGTGYVVGRGWRPIARSFQNGDVETAPPANPGTLQMSSKQATPAANDRSMKAILARADMERRLADDRQGQG